MPRLPLIERFPVNTSMRKFYSSEDEVNEFTFSTGGQAGVNLQDAYKGNVHDLDGKDDPMFPNLGTKVTYIVQLSNKKYTKQKYAQRSKGTVTRAKVTKQVAQVVWDAMREQFHWNGNQSTAPLRAWYLMALIRVGKSSFACLLGQEPSVDATHSNMVDNQSPTSQLSIVCPTAHVDAAPYPGSPRTVRPMSLATNTTREPASTTSQPDDVDAAFRILKSAGGSLRFNLTYQRAARDLAPPTDEVGRRDTCPPSVAPSVTKNQDILPPQAQAVPPPPIYAAPGPDILSAKRITVPCSTSAAYASHPATYIYDNATLTNPAMFLPQRSPSRSPVAAQGMATPLTRLPSTGYPSHVASTTGTQPLPVAGLPSDVSCGNAPDYSFEDLAEMLALINAGSPQDYMSCDGAAGADAHAYI